MKPLKQLAALAALMIAMPFAQASVYSEIEDSDAALAGQGFYPSHDEDGTGALAENEEKLTEFVLTRNETYMFTAVCDDDCTDIDLYVYDDNGQLIELDDEDDDFPIVGFTAEYSGSYYAEVTMYECATKYCGYIVRAYKEAQLGY
ncbi:hypothetical protein [Psychrobacter sp. FDAARGOS_221]|uniref:hypothetical protein n=1 Tax=Psychrobacter sp. FDAARGOS_221 TaxID=1975705 RepID=UPI000BB594F3|nr:hypothetical protein [Psychrobacter sp. FDAARGOS_221]PNK59673.1 hypothetical protein A6J60_001425 [Psychrobacter sp. FDAARGOS_221]